MSISVYNQSVGRFIPMLNNLDAIVTKAEVHATANDIEPAALLQARLFPDMRHFIFQIQVATDIAKGCAARMGGADIPKWADDEVTFADVHARIKKTQDFLATFKPEQFDGSEKKEIELTLRGNKIQFTGESYLLGFAIPNFYFHLVTAYNLLRHNGVGLGKLDFTGKR